MQQKLAATKQKLLETEKGPYGERIRVDEEYFGKDAKSNGSDATTKKLVSTHQKRLKEDFARITFNRKQQITPNMLSLKFLSTEAFSPECCLSQN